MNDSRFLLRDLVVVHRVVVPIEEQPDPFPVAVPGALAVPLQKSLVHPLLYLLMAQTPEASFDPIEGGQQCVTRALRPLDVFIGAGAGLQLIRYAAGGSQDQHHDTSDDGPSAQASSGVLRASPCVRHG